jgi:hypothetical protein
MIDLEKCGGCSNVCGLVELGLGQVAINEIAKSGNHGIEVTCYSGPEPQDGRWTKCEQKPRIQGALRGAEVALVIERNSLAIASE